MLTERVAFFIPILQRDAHWLKVHCMAEIVKFTHEWHCRSIDIL